MAALAATASTAVQPLFPVAVDSCRRCFFLQHVSSDGGHCIVLQLFMVGSNLVCLLT
jgi:hypothetical protein